MGNETVYSRFFVRTQKAYNFIVARQKENAGIAEMRKLGNKENLERRSLDKGKTGQANGRNKKSSRKKKYVSSKKSGLYSVMIDFLIVIG